VQTKKTVRWVNPQDLNFDDLRSRAFDQSSGSVRRIHDRKTTHATH
jgi:hypothetical protein